MKKIFNLYKMDFKGLFKNKFAIIILIALLILPSLYAWFNIVALWDPYGQTKELKVGVYSADVPFKLELEVGKVKEEQNINVGKDVLTELKNNHDFDWQYPTSKEELEENVKSGKYYASIYIPPEFSEDIVSFIKGDIVKPRLEYHVNEKINAIAPKITEQGVTAVQSEISTKFIQQLSETLLKKGNTLGLDLDKVMPKISQMSNVILKIDDNWDKMDAVRGKVKTIANNMPKIEEKVKNLNNITTKFDDLNGKLNQVVIINKKLQEMGDYGPYIENIKGQIPNLEKLSNLLSELDKDDGKIDGKISSIIQTTDSTMKAIQSTIKLLPKNNPLRKNLEKMYEQISSVNASLKTMQENLPAIKQSVHDANEKLNKNIGTLSKTLDKVDSFYHNDFPKIKEQVASLSDFVENKLPNLETKLSANIEKLNTQFPKLATTVINVDTMLDKNYDGIKEQVHKVARILRAGQKGGMVTNLIKLLSADGKAQSDYLADPIDIEETKEYPIPNNGSASAPFYTALSLWVGALLILSIANSTVHVTDGKRYSRREKYFAKLLEFNSIAIVQGLIVSVGNLLMIKIYSANPISYVFTTIFVSVVFMTILYTLVALFNNVGKGIGVVMLVLSISAGGGNYPVELSSGFFQAINPLLPFTYAVNALRETIGGIYLQNYIFDNLFLVIFLIIALLCGTIFQPFFSQLSERISAKVKESHFFH